MYLTLEALINLSPEDLARVESICHEDREWRCDTIGIYEFSYKKYEHPYENDLFELNWLDECGGPTVIVKMDQKINRICYDNYEFTLKLPKAAKKKSIGPLT